MIWVMMNLKNYAGNHGEKILTIFVLIDLKNEIKEDTAFVMKAKHIYRMHSWNETFLINIKVVFN